MATMANHFTNTFCIYLVYKKIAVLTKSVHKCTENLYSASHSFKQTFHKCWPIYRNSITAELNKKFAIKPMSYFAIPSHLTYVVKLPLPYEIKNIVEF